MINKNKIYFASDFHLGMDSPHQSSRERERWIVDWLKEIRKDAKALYLVGDIFDYWFEYKEVVPSGSVRFLSMLAEIVEQGTEVHVFTGNHDLWLGSYLEREIGVRIHRDPLELNFEGQQFYIAHGDGLGPGDQSYKVLKKIFTNPLSNWLFARLHPNFAIRIMRYFSKKSRARHLDEEYLGDKEWLIIHSEDMLKRKIGMDYFIYGHRHFPVNRYLSNGKSRYINLGDWITHRSYAVWEAGSLDLKFYKNQDGLYFQT